MQETHKTWVQSLGQEDPQEKEMAIHCSILAWKIAWMEETGWLQSKGSQRVGHDWVTKHSTRSTLYNICACMCVLCCFGHVWLFATPWTVCSLPGCSVHGILQARILEWTAMPSSRGSSWPRDRIHVSSPALAGSFFTTEPPLRGVVDKTSAIRTLWRLQ